MTDKQNYFTYIDNTSDNNYIEQLKHEFPTETAFQLALFNYVYNGKYKEELQTIKELGNE